MVLLSGNDRASAQAQQNPYSGQLSRPTQQGSPPPATTSSGQPYATETPQQLQQLVAPIALYPDSLVASILAASSYPAEITDANNWMASRRDLPSQQLAAEADQQSWDPSVKSLLPFPPGVSRTWPQIFPGPRNWAMPTTNQQSDVMDAIQVMRRARPAGWHAKEQQPDQGDRQQRIYQH